MAAGASTTTSSNPPRSGTESKNKKKSKSSTSKTLEVPPSEAAQSSSGRNSPHNGNEDGADTSGEKEHIREILKQIRNVNKKLNSMSKVDAIIKENPKATLEELVETRKINADQKAQALKKPQLQAQLLTFEETLSLYRKLDSDYQTLLSKERSALQAEHSRELEKARSQAITEAEGDHKAQARNSLLTFSSFLAAAANRRNTSDESSAESKAFEGALLLVYGGDSNAVDAMEKIINGSSEDVLGVDGSSTGITYEKVRELTLQEIPDDRAQPIAGSDPTIANAGLTELEDTTPTPHITNGASNLTLDDESNATAPANTSIDPDASNAAADAGWDPTKSGIHEDLSESFEIVSPRDAEDSQLPSAPIPSTIPTRQASKAKESWSDIPGDIPTSTNSQDSDGFSEVRHHHPRGGRGGTGGGFHRGGERGGRGGPRGGRGFRGNPRGSRGGPGAGYRGRARGGE